MAQPTPYTPTTDFSQHEASNVGGRSTVKTANLDAEFANVETTLDQTLANLSLVQRDDGELRDARVQHFLRVPLGESLNALPAAVNRPGKFVFFDGSGQPALTLGTGGGDSALRSDLATSGGSALSGFVHSGTGAVARSSQDKMRDVVSVKDFGAVGDGSTTDTTAIQAAIAAAGSTKTLVFPDGTYICGEVTYPDGISWQGYGATLKCPASATVTNNWIRASGTQQGGTIQGLTFDYQTNTNGRHILELGANARNWKILGNTFKNMKTRAAIRADWNVAVAGDGFIEISGNKFTGGQSAGALNFLAQLPDMGIRDISFVNNQVIDCGGSMCMIAMVNSTDDPGAGRFGAFKGTVISGNRFVGNGTGTFGAIPTEMWGHENITVYGNVVDVATRGLGFSWCRNAVCVGNTISNQTFYAHEIGTIDGLLICGETVKNCKQFVIEDSDSTGKPSKNITISGNIIDGSGMSSPVSNVYAIQFATHTNNAGLYRTNVNVTNNKFSNLTYMAGAIRFFAVRYALVSGNEYARSGELEGVSMIRLTSSSDCTVRGNFVNLSGTYTANTPEFDNAPAVMQTTAGALSDRNIVSDNTIVSSVSSFAGSGFIGLGATAGASDYKTLRISDNVLIGAFTSFLFVNDSGGVAIVRDNDTTRATETTTSTVTVSYARTAPVYDATVIPAAGTFTKGAYTHNRNPSPGSAVGWVNTTAGSPGTFSQVGEVVGAGGTVTQATGKTTGVTLNTRTGQITLEPTGSIAAGAVASFTLTNSTIGANDVVHAQRRSGGTAGSYRVWCDSVAAGSCVISVENRTAGALAEALVLQFRALLGANS